MGDERLSPFFLHPTHSQVWILCKIKTQFKLFLNVSQSEIVERRIKEGLEKLEIGSFVVVLADPSNANIDRRVGRSFFKKEESFYGPECGGGGHGTPKKDESF